MTETTDVAKNTERAIHTHITGQYMEAERHYRRALTGLGDETNPTYQDLLTLNVRLLYVMGEFANAQKLGQALLKLREKHFGFHHTQTASALRLLAEIKVAQNNSQSATLDIRRALDIWMDALGWQAPEPDPNDFELHQMAGPRALLPEFDWINGELDQSAALARLSAPQKDARRFTLLLEIANALSWLGMHKTASRLFESATALIERVPPQMIWQSYWAGEQAAQSFTATNEVPAAHAFLTSLLNVLNKNFENGTDVSPVVLVTLSSVEKSMGNYEGAKKTLMNALNLLHGIHGEDHVQVSQIHVKLADLYNELGDIRTSEKHYDKAISILESWHGTSDISLVQPLFKKGLMHKTARNYAQSEKCLGRALEVLVARDQGDIDLAARMFEELALVYMKQFSFQQAQMAQMRGLDLLREHGRPTDLLLARCEVNMASIYLSIAKYVDAEKNATNALHVFEKQPDKVKYKREIATLYIIQGKIETELGKLQPASTSFRQAEGMIETMTEPDIELTKELHIGYANLYIHQGFPAKAVSRFNEVIDLDEGSRSRLLSEKTLEAMIRLTELDLVLGKVARVEDSLLSIVKLTEEKSGPLSADLLASLNALGAFYVNQNKITAAEAVIERGAKLVESNALLGRDPVYGAFLMTYSDLLSAKSSFEIATERLKKALAVYEGSFSSLHPKCADIWVGISDLLWARGVEDQSDEAAHKAVTICSNAFDWNHYATMRAVAFEAYISVKRERYDVAITLAERLMPAITTVRVPPDLRFVKALCEVLKNELTNNRERSASAIEDYLQRNLRGTLCLYNETAIDILSDLMTFIYKRDSRQMAVTIGDAIVDYLGKQDCLVANRKAKLQAMLLKCQDYAYTEESKDLIAKIKQLISQ
ncbi:MAG: tetratricopeptide repeat protein [Candidatus Melainabacteria bacterium]|nr:tetratricopeptide repeat protein [Candidatus Melainabacteria bacterium]